MDNKCNSSLMHRLQFIEFHFVPGSKNNKLGVGKAIQTMRQCEYFSKIAQWKPENVDFPTPCEILTALEEYEYIIISGYLESAYDCSLQS